MSKRVYICTCETERERKDETTMLLDLNKMLFGFEPHREKKPDVINLGSFYHHLLDFLTILFF